MGSSDDQVQEINPDEREISATEQAGVAEAAETTSRQGGLRSVAGRAGKILRRSPVPQALAIALIAGVLGAAYVVAAPPDNSHNTPSSGPAYYNSEGRIGTNPVAVSDGGSKDMSGSGTSGIVAPGAVPAATMGPAQPQTVDGAPALDTAQIVKTGSMSLEVADLDKAVASAQSAIKNLGGYVSDSSRSTNSYAYDASGALITNPIATITFRIPANKWDEALASLHSIGSRVISEQTNSTDVTTQVIDIDARIDNLKKTETALQSIMAQATKVEDILAVQKELTVTRGEIETLTAQSTHLKNQASMSTMTVTLSLPTKPVVQQATEGWSLGAQVDQAGAALVRIGQGLATLAIWALIVALPIGLALLVLLVLAAIVRRLTRRGRKDTITTA